MHAVHNGTEWATSAARPLARVFALLLTAMDDTPKGNVVWMPAHTALHAVGVLLLGNGQALTQADRDLNARADKLAKEAVEEHRIPKYIRELLETHDARVSDTVKWLATATVLANNQSGYAKRDTQACKRAAAQFKRERDAKRAKDGRKLRVIQPPRHPTLGGHTAVPVNGKWTCVVCRRYSKDKRKFLAQRCTGSAATAWAEKAQQFAAKGVSDGGGTSEPYVTVWCGAPFVALMHLTLPAACSSPARARRQ